MMMNGNQAIAMGALAAGCKFISTYPMTPASTITEWLAAHAARFGVVQKQTEDEIAAILMAIGAAHAGVRAMTASSGGGFCLMVETLGLAAMTETPLVIAEVQRSGPSTGLPDPHRAVRPRVRALRLARRVPAGSSSRPAPSSSASRPATAPSTSPSSTRRRSSS